MPPRMKQQAVTFSSKSKSCAGSRRPPKAEKSEKSKTGKAKTVYDDDWELTSDSDNDGESCKKKGLPDKDAGPTPAAEDAAPAPAVEALRGTDGAPAAAVEALCGQDAAPAAVADGVDAKEAAVEADAAPTPAEEAPDAKDAAPAPAEEVPDAIATVMLLGRDFPALALEQLSPPKLSRSMSGYRCPSPIKPEREFVPSSEPSSPCPSPRKRFKPSRGGTPTTPKN